MNEEERIVDPYFCLCGKYPLSTAPRSTLRILCVIHSSDCFTVASGLRNNTTGDLWGVGTNGYAWSSSPTSGSANAGYLDFNPTNVNPLNNNNRAYGFPVRCVQHLQEPLFILCMPEVAHCPAAIHPK
ncbi:MAG: hypothetical protein NC322_01970 [Alistipes senegalensis]|nr:hypothetical protein [Alistipes senegalensis]